MGILTLRRTRNNRPVGDFFCPACKEDYELKSKRSHFGAKVDDGGYRTMIQCVTENTNPNFFFLNYNARNLIVTDLFHYPCALLLTGDNRGEKATFSDGPAQGLDRMQDIASGHSVCWTDSHEDGTE